MGVLLRQVMKLPKWLELYDVSKEQFAKMINKTPNQVHKYMHNGVRPRDATMRAIYIATNCLVDANSFYDLSEEIVVKALEKKRKSEPKMDFRY